MSIRNITYIDLIEACQKPGCLACNLIQEMVENYIRMLFHEHINDPPSRDKLRNSYGLCAAHSWAAIERQLGNALGVAIISHDVIGKLIEDLSEIDIKEDRFTKFKQLIQIGRGGDQRESWLTSEKACPVCLHQRLVEERVLKTLTSSIQKKELSDAIQGSDGLCLPHLRRSLVMDMPPDSMRILLGLAKDRWESLQDELSEFIRKNDYRFSKEGFGAEKDSWLRATAVLKGNRHQQ